MIDKRYQGLVCQIAWSFHCTTGMEYEDLLQECYVIWYGIIERKYDPRRCAFSTWVHRCLTTNLITVANRNKRQVPTVSLEDDIDHEDSKPTPEKQLEFKQRTWHLSDNAKLVVNLVFDSPYEFLALTKKEIVEHLVCTQGWTCCKAVHAVREVSSMLAM